jgi:hypothetical protein
LNYLYGFTQSENYWVNKTESNLSCGLFRWVPKKASGHRLKPGKIFLRVRCNQSQFNILVMQMKLVVTALEEGKIKEDIFPCKSLNFKNFGIILLKNGVI